MSSNVVSLEVEVMYGSDIGDTQMHYGLLKKYVFCLLVHLHFQIQNQAQLGEA